MAIKSGGWCDINLDLVLQATELTPGTANFPATCSFALPAPQPKT